VTAGGAGAPPAAWRRAARRLLYALAIGLTAATVASLLGDVWWVFDIANEFRLQYVIVSLVLVAGAALMRRPRLALVGVLCFALHAASIFGPLLVPRAEAAAGADNGTAFRLTTLNLYYLNRDRQPTLDYIASMRPDVAVFQETLRGWPAALVPLSLEMPYVASIPPEISYFKGLMLFSRYPILDVTYERPVARYLPILIARIAIKDTVVTVIAAHPSHPTSPSYARTRTLYMKAIADVAARTAGPVVVAGDFNSTPWSAPFRMMRDRGGLTDAAARRPWLTTWPTWFPGPGLQLDHVLVNRRVVVRRLERGPNVGSDHYPLTADLVASQP
jgi:endonuclease/exonuclease/phosphatase (EEP) superfamily protein YafD